MATASAEEVFGSSFEHFPPKMRTIFRGLLKLEDFEIPELSPAFEDIRTQINSRWNKYAVRINAPDGPVTLHLNYIDSSSINAITFASNGIHFVGITDKFLVQFSQASSAVSHLEALDSLLEVKLAKETKDFLFQVILLFQLQFISSHELGHLFHGHIDRTALHEEFASEEPRTSKQLGKLRERAHEVDADGYAVHLLLHNFINDESGSFIYNKLGSSLPKEDCLFTLFLLAVGAVFFFLPPKPFDEQSALADDHPFGLARMNVVLYDLIGWCTLHRPGLEKWASLEMFQWVMACVQQASSNPAQQEAWKLQGEFLNSPEGTRYMDELYGERKLLRQDRATRSWGLIPPQGQ